MAGHERREQKASPAVGLAGSSSWQGPTQLDARPSLTLIRAHRLKPLACRQITLERQQPIAESPTNRRWLSLSEPCQPPAAGPSSRQPAVHGQSSLRAKLPHRHRQPP